MSVSYREDISSIDFGELNLLLVEIFGKDKAEDVEHTKTVFKNSQYFEFVFDGDRLIGAARALSDGEWAVIYNFGILPEYRGSEAESRLLSELVGQLNGQHIFVNAVSGDVDFYEKNGFRRTKTAFTYVGEDNGAKDYPEGYFLPEGYRFENEFYKVKLPFPSHHVPERKKDVSLSYSTKRDEIDYKRAAEIISSAFGGDSERPDTGEDETAKTKHLFDISDFVSFAYDGDRLVGVARAISDGLEEAYIQNVAVDPSYQGYGIGWQIVVNLGEEIKRKGLNPFLHTHPGAVGFYNRKGFRRNKTTLDYVGQDTDALSMPPEIERGFYVPAGYRFLDEI